MIIDTNKKTRILKKVFSKKEFLGTSVIVTFFLKKSWLREKRKTLYD